MFSLLKKTQVLDEASILWMFDSFAWALNNFGARFFYDETVLVLPDNAFFPEQSRAADEMAANIFKRVKGYAGLGHWPLRLVSEEDFRPVDPTTVLLPGTLRGDNAQTVLESAAPPEEPGSQLPIPYNMTVLADPQVLISSYAHGMAHYLGGQARQPPPGGEENWPHVTELLAVFLGFGVMMANSAYTTKIRSCASCAGPAVERENYLSQYDITYALAIFCALKDIENAVVTPHLKSTLRTYYKKAHKDVMGKTNELERLRSIA